MSGPILRIFLKYTHGERLSESQKEPNSTHRQIRPDRSRELKFSDYVNNVYLYKASKDVTDRDVTAAARGRQSTFFVPKSAATN